MNRLRFLTILLFAVFFGDHATGAPAFGPEFAPDAGVFRFGLPAKEPDGALTLPPVSFNGARQAGFEPVPGEPNTYRNDVLSVEWTRLNPAAVAITWTARDQVPGEFTIRIADDSDYYGGGERFQAINQKGYILPMVSQDRMRACPACRSPATTSPVISAVRTRNCSCAGHSSALSAR